MVGEDGTFEFELSEGGVPGVFLPTVTVITGSLSPAALSHFQAMRRSASPEQLERAFSNAVMSRWKKVGRRGGSVVVKTNDFDNYR